jgi:hypothetical protein
LANAGSERANEVERETLLAVEIICPGKPIGQLE